MAFQFSAARREKLSLRIGTYGLSGSGKTRGALLMAYGLCHDWSKVFLIDADNRSSLGYVNRLYRK
jgi:adenylylsulfate kinase-like enzyme